jgi:hypothetical protein
LITISNKTQRPLSVPLPRGKVLHLGPGKTGQIASNAADHPPLKELIDSGSLEIVGEGHGSTGATGGPRGGRADTRGHVPGRVGHRGGDR